jgi:integrase/recombinase XerD
MPRKGWHPHAPIIVGDPTDERGMAVMRDKYLEHMAVTNFSPDTIFMRRVYLNYFIKWCQERSILRPNEVTKPIVDRYQRWLYHYRTRLNKPLGFSGQRSRLGAVKAWFRWLTRQNHILSNPASDVDLPRVEKKLPRHVLTAAEVDQVINMTDIDNPKGLRDRAILETLYSTGLRRMEMINLNIYDVDVDRATVLVRKGKFRKDRMVPIGQRALVWLNKYLSEARPQLAPPQETALFVTAMGEPFSANSMTPVVRRYVLRAKLPSGKRGGCHMFRHTMATLMLEGGADLRYVQAMLGHAQLTTTQIYTHVGIRMLQQVHAMTHPTGLMKRPDAPVGGANGAPAGAHGGKLRDDLDDVLVEDPTNKQIPCPPPPPPSDTVGFVSAVDMQTLAAALVEDEDDDTDDDGGNGADDG